MITRRILSLFFIATILSTAFFIGIAGGTSAYAITMKFAHYADEQHPGHIAALQFKNRVEELTKGELQITIYPSNKLGSPPEQLEQTKLGVVDMCLPTQGAMDKYVKAFSVVMLPFVFNGYDHAHKVLDGPAMDWLAPLAQEAGLVMLSNWEWGFRNLTNRVRPVNKPEDVKGLKIRTPPEIQLQAAMEALGAVVTKIAFPELYMALSQGVVDGQENPLAVIYFFKLYEVQKYLALTSHVYNNMIHVVSSKSWDKLTPEQQTIFREESKKAGNTMRNLIMDQERDLLEKLKEKEMVITRPDLGPFRDAMEPAYERIGKYSGEDNVKRFREMAEQCR